MDAWFTALAVLTICAILNFLLTHFFSGKKSNLPPGPLALPLIGNPIWLFKSLSDLEPVLRRYHSQYGPILTVRFLGNAPSIFISGHSASHHALVINGAVFADRFPVGETAKIITSNQHNISTAFYGHTWRVLRRNLTAELLHPSRLKAHSSSRKWALDELCHSLIKHAPTPVKLIDHLRRAMFNLAAAMCFGERFDEKFIKEIEESQRGVLLNIGKFTDLNFWPVKLGKILFRKRWEEIYQLRKRQNDLLLPLINARKGIITNKNEISAIPYVDTLFDLEIAVDNDDEKKRRNLVEDELVTLCSEFLDAITDTTVTSMQWIMANLVKHPEIQEKLYEEIKQVMGERDEIEEEDIQRVLYLKAIVMEGLRLHPPGHLLLPHKVAEDTELEGYKIPKGTSVNFMVADMGWDPKVWANPTTFEPGRFITTTVGEVELDVDITGSKEIKMMPFGAGRRICPGFALGLLHLEYFVGNLVWKFRWTAVGDVDLSEKQESSVTMKHSLLCCLSPRRDSVSC